MRSMTASKHPHEPKFLPDKHLPIHNWFKQFLAGESDKLRQSVRLTGDGGRPRDDRCGFGRETGNRPTNRLFRPASGVQLFRAGPNVPRERVGVAPVGRGNRALFTMG